MQKVVVTMACYENASIEWHTKNFVKFDKNYRPSMGKYCFSYG